MGILELIFLQKYRYYKYTHFFPNPIIPYITPEPNTKPQAKMLPSLQKIKGLLIHIHPERKVYPG